MITPDIINACFEFGAGFAVLHHCFRLIEDKQVCGVSVPAVFFFTVWGVWNIYYYPYLDQFWSFAGGIFITITNAVYLGMLWWYSRRQRAFKVTPHSSSPDDPHWKRYQSVVREIDARTRIKHGLLP